MRGRDLLAAGVAYLGLFTFGGREKASAHGLRLLTFWQLTRGCWFRVWPAPGVLVRAVLGLALAERVRPLFCGRGLPLLFLRRPDACVLLRLFVRPLDAYASPQPSCPQRATCELKRLFSQLPGALRHCVSELRLPSVLRSCAWDSCFLRPVLVAPH
jgi:hypothetical protein